MTINGELALLSAPHGENDPPVTVIREIRVRPDAKPAFEDAMSVFIKVASAQPGHLGATVIRPRSAEEPYRFVYRFDRRSNLEAWHGSDLRARAFTPIKDLIKEDRFDEFTGLETWFELPDVGTKAPPKWKTTLMTWGVIYVLVVAVSYGMSALGLALAVPLRALVLTGIVVPVASYVVGPWVGKALHGWLHAGL